MKELDKFKKKKVI